MKPAPLVGKVSPQSTTKVSLGQRGLIGGSDIFIAAGPCAIESLEQLDAIAQALIPAPIQALRGGVFKPRTSPYDFQGMGAEGFEILQQVRQHYGLPVVTEVMAVSQIEALSEAADMLQVGSRNMQNFDLLKALGQAQRPILLKRGLSATIEEFVMAAEYIASHGNPNIVLCERGIRSFDNYTRNVLDLGAVVALKTLTHLPVIVDPSHAAGRRDLVPGLARAAIAAGADGLIIECHPRPDEAISDAKQTLSLESMAALIDSLKPIAAAVGRTVADPVELPQHADVERASAEAVLLAA